MSSFPLSNTLDTATPQQITDHIHQANTAHRSSKTAAARAAAYIYMVYRATMSEFATTANRDYIDSTIAEYDADIAKFNVAVNQLEELSVKLAAGDIIVDNLDTKPDLADAHRAEYDGLAKHVANKGSFVARDHHKVKAKSGRKGSELSTLIKVILCCDHAKDDSVPSRYAKVVSLLQDAFNDKEVNDPQDLIDFIDGIGGFERALLRARGSEENSNSSKKTVAYDTKAIAAYIASQLNRGIVQTTLRFNTQAEDKELVLLFGCVNGSNVDIVDEFIVDDMDAVITRYRGECLPVSNDVQFLSNVARLGRLISAAPTTKGTKPARSNVLTMLPAATGPASLLVSSAGSAASIIVQATPAASAGLFAKAATVRCMNAENVATLEHELRDRVAQSGINIAVKDENGTISWVATSPLYGDSHSVTLPWVNVTDESAAPFAAIGFTANFSTTIAKADVFEVRELRFSSAKPSPKNSQSFVLDLGLDKFSPSTFGRPLPEYSEDDISASVTCRETDICALFDLLKTQQTDTFSFAIDEDKTMLEVTWTDQVGSYKVFVPAANDDGTLNAARIAKVGVAQAGTVDA